VLNQFFQKRVYDKTQTMNWDINGNLRRKGKDTEFDKLLQDTSESYQIDATSHNAGLDFGKQMVERVRVYDLLPCRVAPSQTFAL